MTKSQSNDREALFKIGPVHARGASRLRIRTATGVLGPRPFMVRPRGQAENEPTTNSRAAAIYNERHRSRPRGQTKTFDYYVGLGEEGGTDHRGFEGSGWGLSLLTSTCHHARARFPSCHRGQDDNALVWQDGIARSSPPKRQVHHSE